MAAEQAKVDPMYQFTIEPLAGSSGWELAGYNIAFTNSALWMLITTVVLFLFVLGGMKRELVPGRWQMMVESFTGFIDNMLEANIGKAGRKYVPYVFSLFMFVLAANLIGMFPYAFTVTSHIIVTFSLAMLVFLTVTIYGLWRNGLGFLRLFMPSGVPIALAPIIVPIEIVSYISRPISHSVRLFAVMLAGHITLKVFAGFVVSLGGMGALGMFGAILPLVMTVALTGLEFLMSVIQAYIFTMLTCMYLKDALHPDH